MPSAPFVRRVAELELEPALLDPGAVLEGSPEVSELVPATSEDGRVVRGVPQITHRGGAGVEAEADELVVVVSGRAVWQIHETLRKAFQITDVDTPG